MVHIASWCAVVLVTSPSLVLGIPLNGGAPLRRGGVSIPLVKNTRRIFARGGRDGDILGGSVGLGDKADLTYTVAVTVGSSTTALNIDTGSSDLWVITQECKTEACEDSGAQRYDDSRSFQPSGGSVDLRFGDSLSGTHASGLVGRDTVTLAALTMANQTIAAVDDTDNFAVANGGAGVLGLGFPAQSFVQAAIISAEIEGTFDTDTFVEQTGHSGPIVPRLILSDAIAEPMFTVTLQRDTIDVSGHGQLTIGQLPEGIDNSSITWVPVRLYDQGDGGLVPPSFAPDEVYPLRWEVELDAVFLDGEKLPDSTEQASDIKQPSLSALIDTGNSLLRGPADVVGNILTKVSPAFAADQTARPTLPCTAAHTLAFQIGGKLFPIDPRDFVAQAADGDSTNCIADNIVSTDPPGFGALFSWNLGDPFFKSTMVVFYYGNLTHPSVDPPRMGFMSLVPPNADELLRDAVEEAQKAGGNFESTIEAAPTASSLILKSATRASDDAASGASASSPASTHFPDPSSDASKSGAVSLLSGDYTERLFLAFLFSVFLSVCYM